MRQMHGPKLANLKREVDAFRRNTGIRHGIGSLDKLFNSQWQPLRERIFPSAHDIELREASIRAAKTAPVDEKPQDADSVVQDHSDVPVTPPTKESSKSEQGKVETSRHDDEAKAEQAEAEQMAPSTDDSDVKVGSGSVNPVSGEKPVSAGAVADATDSEEPPMHKVQTETVVDSIPAASPRLRLAPDRFRLTYFAARGRLNILDMETGDQWNVTKSGLSVEGDDKGHVSSMPIGETGFTITTSPKCIVLRDDRCGYEFTIMF